MILRAVLMPVPASDRTRSPEQVRRQRETARTALRESARRSGAPDAGWEQDERGIPLPNRGFNWSISHKPAWAAAVVADRPVGIDVEHVRPRTHRLHDHLAHDAEWALLGNRSWESFFRLWTAKEATLKAHGKGIGELLTCRLVEVEDERHVRVVYAGKEHRVEHFIHEGHIAAVTCEFDRVEWIVLEGPAR
ncbi:MAG: 4'-phosphopantetheinyl transferase superfamily protein [Planctomycetota bacterium]|nr:MAG: 4'-phosphopantetheinyl transferase superfamily protein [Planctomycetota bacterium]